MAETAMRRLSVNLQFPPSATESEIAEAEAIVTQGLPPSTMHRTSGTEDVQFVSLTFSTTDILALWSCLKKNLSSPPSNPNGLALLESSIVVCEGDHG